MKFGLRYCNIGPLSRREPALELAQYAEDAGFESLWTIEHVVIPAGYQSKYPYSDDGRFGWPEDLDYPDPIMWLATIAGVTSTMKLVNTKIATTLTKTGTQSSVHCHCSPRRRLKIRTLRIRL